MVRSWLDQGFDVIAHGPFLSAEEDAALVHALPADVRPRRVLLTATLSVALDRATSDPERMLSRYPEVLEATYQRFDQLRPTMPACEWTFDTTTVGVARIVEQLSDALSPD